MAAFEWVLKQSSHFGKVWVPVVVAQIQSSSGTFKLLHMFVDSGAIVSFVPCSLADELGINLESGRSVRLANVAGGHNDAFVHELTVRLDDDEPAMLVPVAFATREGVPNLLGRLGVFDQRRNEFDPQQRLTRIDPVPA
jgi:predicted aspartyl protease